LRRHGGTGRRLSAAGGLESSASGGAGSDGRGRTLRLLLGELGDAKRRLLDETEALRIIESRVRG